MEDDSQTIFAFSAPNLSGQPVSLADYRERVLLIVNTASKCGFTPQYEGLETLYRAYRDRGFSILAFPCNQFGAQEPGSEAEIDAFCRTNYRVSFPLFAKISVNGPGAHPLYQFLKKEKPGIFGIIGANAIRWNFTKFLTDRQGRVVARYSPAKAPAALAPAIEKLLDEE
jgi:glutathione peroxidase